jgi:iron complex outermembrane receptor protein
MPGPFKELRVRAGWADYRHDEIEADGAIGTSFFNHRPAVSSTSWVV